MDWKVDELNKFDRTTRKTLTMYGAFRPKCDVDRLYVKRKDGGRDLIGIKSRVHTAKTNPGSPQVKLT